MSAIAALVLAAAAGQQFAPLKPGDMLYNGADQQVKVLQCRPVVYGRECQTVLWERGGAASTPAWWDELMLQKGDARVRTALGQPPRGGTQPVAAAPARPRAASPAPGGRVPDGTYACQIWMGNSYVSLGKVRSAGGRLSPDLLAKVGATMTGVAPSADGITISYTTARGYRESMDCKRG